jgi:hypothetical protein
VLKELLTLLFDNGRGRVRVAEFGGVKLGASLPASF